MLGIQLKTNTSNLSYLGLLSLTIETLPRKYYTGISEIVVTINFIRITIEDLRFAKGKVISDT